MADMGDGIARHFCAEFRTGEPPRYHASKDAFTARASPRNDKHRSLVVALTSLDEVAELLVRFSLGKTVEIETGLNFQLSTPQTP